MQILACFLICFLIIFGISILFLAVIYYSKKENRVENTSCLTESDIEKFVEYSKALDYKDIG